MNSEKATEILDKIAKEKMIVWDLEEFKKSHPSLFDVIISSMQKAASMPRKKEKKVVPPPTLEEVKKYFKDNGYSEEAAIRAFNHYEAGKDPATGQWRDSQGSPVVIWKQKVRTNWFNDRNKIGAFTGNQKQVMSSPGQPAVYSGSFFDKDKKISSPEIKLDANGFGKAE